MTGTLGQGGMGIVLEARHPTLPIDVAVKVLRGDSLDDDALARFRGEVLALARIQHPNVVPVLDAGRAADGSPYYVMPKIAGRSLLDILQKEGALEPKSAAAIVAKLARALHHVHVNAGVVHRDMKPSNVLLEEGTGEPKLFDFGLAKTTGKSAHLTQSGIVVGTPDYMAPEQASGKAIDPRTDVYGLGALLFTLLTGRPPLEGKGRDVPTVLMEASSSERISAAQLRPDLPRELVAISRRCLAVERGDRYGTALELALDLERFAKKADRAAAAAPSISRRTVTIAWLAGLLPSVALLVLLLEARQAAETAAGDLAKEKEALAIARDDLEHLHKAERARSLLREARSALEQGALGLATGKPHDLAILAREKTRDARRDSETEDVLVEAGEILFRAALYPDAREALERAALISPESLRPLALLHHVAHAERSPCDKVRARLKALASRRRETNLDALASELETAGIEKDGERQLQLLNDPAWHVKPTAFSEKMRGQFLLRSNFRHQALVAFATAATLLPDDPEALALRADAYGRLGSNVYALLDAEAALARDPDRPLAHFAKARVLLAFGEAAGAIEETDLALKQEPDDADLWAFRARACIVGERFDDALGNADHALSLAPRATAHLVRALVLAAKRKGDEALEEAGRGIQLDPGDAWAHTLRSSLLSYVGRTEPAQAECAAALEVIRARAQDHDPQIVLSLVEALVLAGQQDGARRWAREVRNLYATWGREVPPGVSAMMKHLGVE